MGRKLNYKGFDDFARRGVSDLKKRGADLDTEIHKGVHRAIGEVAVSLTPTDEGEMKRSWGSVVGRGGRRPLNSGLNRLKPGGASKVVNSAAHALVIDMGRSTGNPHGSPRAPQGVSKPAMNKVASQIDQIRAKVIADIEGK